MMTARFRPVVSSSLLAVLICAGCATKGPPRNKMGTSHPIFAPSRFVTDPKASRSAPSDRAARPERVAPSFPVAEGLAPVASDDGPGESEPIRLSDDSPAPRSRAQRRPIQLWPFVDIRSYDRKRDGVDARLTDYLDAWDLELFWPFFAHYEWTYTDGTEGGHSHLFPFYYSSHKGEVGYSVAFPFWWSHWAYHKSWWHLFPIAGEYEKGSYHKTFLVDPLFSYGEDSVTGAWDINLLWPLGRFEGNGKSGAGRIAPFLFYGRSEERNYTHIPPVYFEERRPGKWGTRVVFPFWWEHWREDGTRGDTRVVPPFYGNFEWGDDQDPKSLETVFPFYWKYRSEKQDADVVFPIYWDIRNEKGLTRVLFPFWFQYEPREGRPARVLFPFYWDLGEDKRNGPATFVPPVYLYAADVDEEAGVEAITPLYWRWWTDTGKGWTLLPFYAHHRGKDNRLDTVLPPLFWHTKYGDTTGTVLFPFWWQFETPSQGKYFRALPPFVWDFCEEQAKVRGTVLFPFYTRVVTQGGDDGVVVAPPYMHAWWDDSQLTAIPPFYAEIKDAEKQTAWRSVIPPLFWWFRSPGRDIDFFPPYWRHENKRKKSGSAGLFPLYWESWDDRKQTHRQILFPFLFDLDSGPRGSRFRTWPFLWSLENRRKRSHHQGIFPLLYDLSWNGGEERFTTLFPFVWHMANPEWSFDYVFPFWGRYTEEPGYTRDFILFPLATYERDRVRGTTGLDVLWPLFSYYDSPTSESWRALPFWYHHTRKADGRDVDMVLPFVCHIGCPDYRYRHVFPFWFEYIDRRGGPGKQSGVASLLGPLWVRSFDESEDLWRHDVLWPLFTHRVKGEENSLSIRPLFYHTADAERSGSILFPFFYHHAYEKGSQTAVAPFFWQEIEGEEVSRLLLPLYYEHTKPGEGARVLFPFYWNFWDRDRSHLHLWPFYGHDQVGPADGKAWRQDSVLYPFFRIETDDRAKRELDVHAPWPLFHYGHTIESEESYDWSFTGAPFIHASGKESGGTVIGFLPPFGWDWGRDYETGLLPFFYHHHDSKWKHHENVLFPFLWSIESPRSSTFHLWPLFGRRMVWDEKGNLEKWEVSAGYPFLFNAWRDCKRDETELDFLWPLCHFDYDGHQGEAQSAHFRFFPFLWYGWKRDAYQYSSLFPLWYQRRSLSSENDWQFDLLWPLFSVRRDDDFFHSRLLPLWWYEADDDQTTLVAPLSFYWKRRDAVDAAVLFPLFHYGSDEKKDKVQVNLLWPLGAYEKVKDRVHAHALPFFWHDQDADDSFTLVPPLLSWNLSGKRFDSTGLLFPLFKHRWDGTEDERQIDLLFPLFSYRRHGDASHCRLLPLWWVDRDRDESLTVIPPLLSFQYSKGKEGFGSFLFPLTWWSWEEGKSSSFRLLWEVASYAEEGDAWDFRIFYKLFHLGRRGHLFEFELLPFFRFETWKGQLSHFSLLGGTLFSYDWDPRTHKTETRLFYFLKF